MASQSQVKAAAYMMPGFVEMANIYAIGRAADNFILERHSLISLMTMEWQASLVVHMLSLWTNSKHGMALLPNP